MSKGADIEAVESAEERTTRPEGEVVELRKILEEGRELLKAHTNSA